MSGFCTLYSITRQSRSWWGHLCATGKLKCCSVISCYLSGKGSIQYNKLPEQALDGDVKVGDIQAQTMAQHVPARLRPCTSLDPTHCPVQSIPFCSDDTLPSRWTGDALSGGFLELIDT